LKTAGALRSTGSSAARLIEADLRVALGAFSGRRDEVERVKRLDDARVKGLGLRGAGEEESACEHGEQAGHGGVQWCVAYISIIHNEPGLATGETTITAPDAHGSTKRRRNHAF
jgi:hypothetical protein